MDEDKKKKTGRTVGRPPTDPENKRDMRNYNLALNRKQFEEVQGVAREEGTSFLSVIQGMVKTQLFLRKAVKNNDAQIILRTPGKDGEKDSEQQIIIL